MEKGLTGEQIGKVDRIWKSEYYFGIPNQVYTYGTLSNPV
jgi:hypothetical protein